MNEKRRLKIANRQLVMAQIARREARFALANAIGEEERSGEIYSRARDLLREYEIRIYAKSEGAQSHTLQSNFAFVHTLQSMAGEAEQAYKDASDQAQWQMQALAQAETRLDARETRVNQEKRALQDKRDQRELTEQMASQSSMARKLHNQDHTGDGTLHKGNSKAGPTQP